MDASWQFVAPIISTIISGFCLILLERVIPQRLRNWQMIFSIIATITVIVTGLFFGASQIFIVHPRPGVIDVTATSTRSSVFTKQVNGQTFIGVTYELGGGVEKLNPNEYKDFDIKFDVTPASSDYYLVVGDDTDNKLLLTRSNPGSGVSYRRLNETEEFTVPIKLFNSNLNFNQIHVMTPYQPSVDGQMLSFSIQKLLLLPKP